jgi:enoyl-CoA hydratase/carnithine racemase
MTEHEPSREEESGMYQEITYEVVEPVATITLDRPKALNAWTTRMGAEVKHALAAAEADARVVAIVLTGAGRGFCAGADLNDLKTITEGGRQAAPPAELDAAPGDAAMASFRGSYTYIASLRKPVIAAINGPVAGMAVPIALACDLRFASDRASFTTSFSRRGLVAEWGVSWLLPRLVGTAHALDLLFSARRIDAEEAARIGLVNRVLPHDELLPYARTYVEDLAANCSPASMAIMKRQVWQHWTAELDAAEEEAVRLMLDSFNRPDFKEGVVSFLQKRPPRFSRIGG